jgi:hypothetical protein
MSIQTQRLSKVQTRTSKDLKTKTKAVTKSDLTVSNTRLVMLIITLLAAFVVFNYSSDVNANKAKEEIKMNQKKIEEEKANRLAKVNDESAKKNIDYTKVKLREENNLNVG